MFGVLESSIKFHVLEDNFLRAGGGIGILCWQYWHMLEGKPKQCFTPIILNLPPAIKLWTVPSFYSFHNDVYVCGMGGVLKRKTYAHASKQINLFTYLSLIHLYFSEILQSGIPASFIIYAFSILFVVKFQSHQSFRPPHKSPMVHS